MERRSTPGAPAWVALHAWVISATACAAAGFVLVSLAVRLHAATPDSQADRRREARLDEALKREGDALIELADGAMKGRSAPSDFGVQWKNDFLKAQPGTFVPFTLTIDRLEPPSAGALVYLRVVPLRRSSPDKPKAEPYAHETIFSVDREALSVQPLRIRRGFAVPPGSYTVYVALRESPADLLERSTAPRKASVLVQTLDVPDFWTEGLATSTVMLADRVEQLAEPIPPGRLAENPYVVGASRIHPAPGASFRRGAELIVVFLIYNPSVGSERQFDVQVDYHLYRKLRAGEPPGEPASAPRPQGRPGERYVTRTNPQRFNPSMMGAHFDPAGGQPVLAGQGILLAGFEDGEYRLGITITDLLSRKTVARDVAFTVIGS